ncbi:bifunctional riboflavin kinase/FAD synthetase [Thiolinea disciformis]|uniref:bifunctional riboflavin kinase/FAD synthetase n=1 Tax=Thiolinea disciformis TaxID=125614 RepID=UPI00036517F4|nr:bifunctional riboflavin kinase/FAD synthetase [Thiolinea disciformis]
MKILRHPSSFAALNSGCVATIGNFDGVHLGHQQVIQQVKQQAQAMGLPSVVISFEPLPTEYFGRALPRIYPLRDKAIQLAGLGIDYFVCLAFNRALADMAAEDFVTELLLHNLQVRYLVVGDDFRFGRGRAGDYRMLQELGAGAGMQVVDTPTFVYDEQRVSSTRIRQALAEPDLGLVKKLLGGAYGLSGRVRHGDKRGRTINFPTLNLRIPDSIALAKGVYAVLISGLGKHTLKGVANVGARPTVNGVNMRLETHVFDFNAQVYQKQVCIEPIAYLRPEQRFESFDALKAQIVQDAEQARSLLAVY